MKATPGEVVRPAFIGERIPGNFIRKCHFMWHISSRPIAQSVTTFFRDGFASHRIECESRFLDCRFGAANCHKVSMQMNSCRTGVPVKKCSLKRGKYLDDIEQERRFISKGSLEKIEDVPLVVL